MTTFLSQGVDYLGFLEAKLRDLRGHATLAYELIQNADDAQASSMLFDVQDKALVVENMSTFSDCGQIEADECPWRNERGHRCDFHRFRKVASGDKREQEGTTGAFGIGFISVYQITDSPELISGKRRWIIRPDAEETRRIEARSVEGATFEGTRFIFPWALNEMSPLRRRLRTQAVRMPDTADVFIDVLSKTLPDAILFLKHVRRIELRRNGTVAATVQRIDDGDQVVVQHGKELRLWRMLSGSFDGEADRLKKKYSRQIEQKRTARVTVAIPEQTTDFKGLFCACLPTEQLTDLPFHINADFYPSTDRKRILLTDDYQGEWNRAAIAEAAGLVADALSSLPQLLGRAALWELLDRLKQVYDAAEDGQLDRVFKEFWTKAQPPIKTSPTVAIWPEGWKTPADVFLLEQPAEEAALPLLHAMGFNIVHPDLRRHFLLLRAVGVRALGLADLVEALKKAGLDTTVALEEAPEWIRSRNARELLGQEIAALSHQRVRREVLDQACQDIRRCAIALARNGYLRSPATLFNPSKDDADLLMALGCENVLVADDNPDGIAELVETLTPARMLTMLEEVNSERFEKLWQEHNEIIFALIDWFAGQSQIVRTDNNLKQRLRALPIWPSGNALYPLDDLYMAGDFEDPLGLAILLDRTMRRRWRDFVRDLGARWLNIQRYARELVPQALKDPEAIGVDACRELILLFAMKLSEIRDDAETRGALSRCPLVECRDGVFRTAKDVYFFEAAGVVDTLGDVPLARLLPDHPEAVRDLYRWLGVADEPRLADIVQRLAQIVATPPAEESRHIVAQIFQHLSNRKIEPDNPELQQLRRMRWLPCREDRSRWFAPNEISAAYQDYLFASQANFLDFDRRLQEQGRDFLKLLGVQLSPTPTQVVKHLQWAAANGRPVNKEVYRFLDDKADDPAVLQLQDCACLLLDGGKYLRPTAVFWSDHPYGRYRYRLTSGLRSYERLFTRLGVREGPTMHDALLVLCEIAIAFQETKEPLDEHAHSVLLACWQQLNQALERGDLAEDTLKAFRTLPVIPTEDFRLRAPVEMFHDDRPGLAERFPDFKGACTVPRMLGSWRAMEAAGVRPLSEAVHVSLVECELPEPAEDIAALLRDRRQLILRVIGATRAGREQDALDLLDRIRVERVVSLVVQYTVRGAGAQKWTSKPEQTPAYLDPERGIIYIQRQTSALQRTALARALAEALDTDGDPLQMASGLKEVLIAPSVSDASLILDMLGYAQIAITEPTRVEHREMDLGAEAYYSDEDDVDRSLNKPEPDNDGIDAGASAAEAIAEAIDGHDATSAAPTHHRASRRAAARTSNGSGAGSGQGAVITGGSDGVSNQIAAAENGHSESAVTGNNNDIAQGAAGVAHTGAVRSRPSSNNHPEQVSETDRAGAERVARNSTDAGRIAGEDNRQAYSDSVYRQRGRLRTYVMPARDGVSGDGAEAVQRKSEIDRAGISRVIEYERRSGRYPREMTHDNPGYDIESCDIAGNVLRYIEVKSVADVWNSQGVGLSATQFYEGHLYKERYWLYVVERAASPDARIYRIQDPARRVDQFLYDDGWRDLAEGEDEPVSTPPGSAESEEIS